MYATNFVSIRLMNWGLIPNKALQLLIDDPAYHFNSVHVGIVILEKGLFYVNCFVYKPGGVRSI